VRYTFVILGWFLFHVLPAVGEPVPSADSILRKAREAFWTAKSSEQIESVKVWCRDSLGALILHESNRMIAHAAKLREADNVEEADAIVKRVIALKAQNEQLAQTVCKPN
jgi:hypothetical protein